MKIQNQAYVSIQYKLTLDSGTVADESDPAEPLSFIWGMDQIIPGLEAQLEGMEVGQTKQITVEATEGYGERSDELLLQIPRSRFPEDVAIEPGMMFHGPGGRVWSVTGVKGEEVTVDANHPLAGERLHFDVKVSEVRQATEEELKELEEGCGGCCGGCGSDHEGCH